MNRVVVFGSLNQDAVLRMGALPLPGETVSASELLWAGGGKGANQAFAAGAVTGEHTRVAMVGCVGSDDVGRGLIDELAAANVDTSNIATVAGPTGFASVLVDDAGENVVVVYPGANEQWPESLIDSVPLGASDVVLLQQEIPSANVRSALLAGRRAGARTVLNAAPARDLSADTLALVDVLVVNELEHAALFGAPEPSDETHATVREVFPGDLVVTLGGRGAVVFEGDEAPVRVPSFTVDVRDTVGAGDAFTGALAAMLADGHSLAEATHLANAAGALTATVSGARHPGLSREAIARLRSDQPLN